MKPSFVRDDWAAGDPPCISRNSFVPLLGHTIRGYWNTKRSAYWQNRAKMKHRRKRFEIHLITKMSDMTRPLEVIYQVINITVSSSLKLVVVYNVSQRISARALKCVFNFGFLSRMKSISRLRQSSFPWYFFKTENCFRSSGFEIPWQPFTCVPTLMEMTSSVAARENEGMPPLPLF